MFNQLHISAGNRKLGAIPSVSLPAVITCRKNAPCAKDCYARKIERLYKNVRNSYAENLEIYKTSPDSYFMQLNVAVMMNKYFRLHVSGDFPTADYFKRCIAVAVANPDCKILAFTKQYEIVNAWIDENGDLPANFKVIFSEWPGLEMNNPHGLPESHVIFKDTAICDEWKICGGNCTECACRGVGCWELKAGEHIAFYKH